MLLTFVGKLFQFFRKYIRSMLYIFRRLFKYIILHKYTLCIFPIVNNIIIILALIIINKHWSPTDIMLPTYDNNNYLQLGHPGEIKKIYSTHNSRYIISSSHTYIIVFGVAFLLRAYKHVTLYSNHIYTV